MNAKQFLSARLYVCNFVCKTYMFVSLVFLLGVGRPPTGYKLTTGMVSKDHLCSYDFREEKFS